MTAQDPTERTAETAASYPDGGLSDSAPVQFATLRKRAAYLAASRARYRATPGFLVQARRRTDADAVASDLIRVGFTCSKKVGNAVARNRAKRRLRALARAVLCTQGKPGWDYVLVGRKAETARRPFASMEAELRAALDQLHRPAKPRP